MAGLARRLAPAAALGGLAVVIVGVADPAIAGRAEASASVQQAPAEVDDTSTDDTATKDSTTTDATTTDSTTTDPSAGSGGSDAQAASSCDAGDLVTGDSVMTRWGPVQVAATVSGGRVCEVHAVTWPSGDGRSQMINAYAIPQLDQMATQSEGTQLDYVSGATYTSNGYAQSLQSILDAL